MLEVRLLIGSRERRLTHLKFDRCTLDQVLRVHVIKQREFRKQARPAKLLVGVPTPVYACSIAKGMRRLSGMFQAGLRPAVDRALPS